jgi:hypothetical protein
MFEAGETVSGTPQWSGNGTPQNLTLVDATTSSGSNNDMALATYALVNPTVETNGTVTVTHSSNDNSITTAVNYIGTVSSSVANAIQFLAEDVNDAATNTLVFSSAGTAGNCLYGSFKGGDGDPSSNNASFNELYDAASGTSTNADIAGYVIDLLDNAPQAVTCTWNATDENAGHYLEIVAASGSNDATVSATTGAATASVATTLTRDVSVAATTGAATASVATQKTITALVNAGLGTRTDGNTDPQIRSSVGWTLNEASISGGKLVIPGTGGTAGKGSPPGATNVVAGRTYYVEYKIVNHVDGAPAVQLGGALGVFGSPANGVYSGTITATLDGDNTNTHIVAGSAVQTFDIEYLTITEYQGGATAAIVAEIQANEATVTATTGAATASVAASIEHPASVVATTAATTASAVTETTHPATVAAQTAPATASILATVIRAVTVDANIGATTASIQTVKELTASVTATTGAATASSTTETTHPASVAADTGAATASVSTATEHPASVDATAGAVTASANTETTHPASVDATTGATTAAAVATVTPAAGENLASVAATTGSATASVTASVEHQASVGANTAPATAVVQTSTEHPASVDATTGAATAAGVATIGNSADVDATTGAATAAVSATIIHLASVSAITGAATASALVTGRPSRYYSPIREIRERPVKSRNKVRQKIRQVVREKIEHRPSVFSRADIAQLVSNIDVLLRRQYELAKLQEVLTVALKVEQGKAVKGPDLPEMVEANEVVLPVIEEVIQETIEEKRIRKEKEKIEDYNRSMALLLLAS